MNTFSNMCIYFFSWQEIDVRALKCMYVFTISLRIDNFKYFSVHLKELTHLNVVSIIKIFVHWQFGLRGMKQSTIQYWNINDVTPLVHYEAGSIARLNLKKNQLVISCKCIFTFTFLKQFASVSCRFLVWKHCIFSTDGVVYWPPSHYPHLNDMCRCELW